MNAAKKQTDLASTEAWNEFNKSALETASQLAHIAFGTAERLLRLQMDTQRENFSSVYDNVDSIQSMKTSEDVEAFRQRYATPSPDRAIEYSEELLGIIADTQKELSKTLESQREEFNAHFNTLLDTFAKSAPSGTDGWVEGMRSALVSSSAWIDNMQRASDQWRQATEANLKAAAEMAHKALKKDK